MNEMNAALFIPCYSCGEQTIRLLQNLSHELLAKFSQIIIVDNASPDGSAKKIRDFLIDKPHLSSVKIFQNNKNYGLGGSFKRAWLHLKEMGHTHIFVLHGDNQANPQDVLKFFAVYEKEPKLVAALGARFSQRSVLINYSFSRKFFNKALNYILTIFSGKKIDDLGSGLASFDINSFDTKMISALPDHTAFDLHLLFYLLENKLPFMFLPIEWKSEDEVSTIKTWEVGFYLLNAILMWRVGKLSTEFSDDDILWSKSCLN